MQRRVYTNRLNMRTCAICTPEIYNSEDMQRQILDNRKANPWIFDIIHNKHNIEPRKNCIIKRPEWTLVMHRVKHNSEKEKANSVWKYLIVFHDENLHSLRHLREQHINLLKEIKKVVTTAMQMRPESFHLTRRPNTVHVYFHYWPSVFQLHAHVVTQDCYRPVYRCHDFKHVIRNLSRDGEWYKKAMLMTTFNRTIQKLC